MDYVQMTLDEWVLMKESLKNDLIGVQCSFVRIGYTLRKIEEQKLYEKDGYTSIAEFAKKEYGLGASTVSRFISINKKYSIDGYSEKLRPEFANLGSSKLSEMLSLPDSDLEMIKPDAAREHIRDLKDFNKTAGAAGADEPNEIVTVIEKFYKDNKEILNELYSSEAYKDGRIENMAEIINPAGTRTYRSGLYFLMMYEENIKVKKFNCNPYTMNWDEFFAITQEIFKESAAGSRTYANHFGEEPVKETPKPAEEKTVAAKKEKSIAPAQKSSESLKTLNEEPLHKESAKQEKSTEIDTEKEVQASAEPEEKDTEVEEIHSKDAETVINPPKEPVAPAQELPESPEMLNAEPIKENVESAAEPIETEVLEKPMTRKEFLDHLDTRAFAEYMANEMYVLRMEKYPELNKADFWYSWLQELVDSNGEQVEKENTECV